MRPSSELVPMITSTSVLNWPDLKSSSGFCGRNGSEMKSMSEGLDLGFKKLFFVFQIQKIGLFLSAMSLPCTSKDLNYCPSSALPQNLDKNINSFNIQIT